MAAGRAHRACRTDDVLSCVFSQLELRDGCVGAASVSKQWRGAWRRRAKGLYRPLLLGVSSFAYGDHLTALPGGGVIVPDYEGGVLHLFTAEGELRGAVDSSLFKYATAVALDDEGVSWVVLHDHFALARRRVDYATLEYHSQASPPDIDFHRPMDVAASGDAVLLLSHDVNWRYGEVIVLDRGTGDVRYRFGSSAPGSVDELRAPSGLAVDGDFCFVADTYNQSVVVFNWRDGTFVRRYGKAGDAPELGDDGEDYWDVESNETYDDDRKSAEPGHFYEPFDVAVRNRLLYVSEKGGRRIQVLRLPDDLSASDPEFIQIIPSPGGVELAGLCVDGDRLWCIGPPMPGHNERSTINIFAPIV
jgi:hypothetical protein